MGKKTAQLTWEKLDGYKIIFMHRYYLEDFSNPAELSLLIQTVSKIKNPLEEMLSKLKVGMIFSNTLKQLPAEKLYSTATLVTQHSAIFNTGTTTTTQTTSTQVTQPIAINPITPPPETEETQQP